jgi:hypothetical protein
MVKTIALSASLLVMSALPALAQSACMEPIAPAAVNGATATMAQMKAAHDDTMTFIKQSDDYQMCMFKELTDLKAATLKDKKDNDPSAKAAIDTASAAVDAKVKANQVLKQKVGDEFNAAVATYKAAHPG